MKKWPIIASLLAVMLLASGCGVTSPTPPPAGMLEVVDHSMIWGESGSAEVSVTIKNVGHSTIELAEVTVKFYAAKNFVGASSDAVMNLGPGETWDFKITCSGTGCDRVINYKVTATARTSSRGF